MTDLDEAEVEDIDLAVVAYLDDGAWELDDLPDHALGDLDALAAELTYYPAPALAMVTVADDFALLVRDGAGPRVLLSDATAATEWVLARAAVLLLGAQVDPDEEDPVPVGDLSLLVDVGVSARQLADLLADEMDPEDFMVELAGQLGFGDDLEDLLEDLDDDEDED